MCYYISAYHLWKSLTLHTYQFLAACGGCSRSMIYNQWLQTCLFGVASKLSSIGRNPSQSNGTVVILLLNAVASGIYAWPHWLGLDDMGAVLDRETWKFRPSKLQHFGPSAQGLEVPIMNLSRSMVYTKFFATLIRGWFVRDLWPNKHQNRKMKPIPSAFSKKPIRI